MSTHRADQVRRFRGSTIYDWESEPAEERPTGFGESTGFSGSSGYFHSTSASSLEYHRRRLARQRRRGSGGLMLGLLVVLAATTGVLYIAGRVLSAFR